MKQMINAIAKHPVIYCFSSIIILIFCLGIIRKLHPLLIIAVFFLPFLFLLAPSLANKIDPVAIEVASSNGFDSGIKVLERKSANRRVLSLCRHRESYHKYNPASATFSAATVGGVTTGGWSVKEAHYTTEMGAATDKYLLCYTPNVYYKNQCSFPSRVVLTQNDAQAARDQGFGKFLEGETLVLRNPGKWKNAKNAADAYASTGDFYGASNLLVKDYTASLLTESEMREILDFLCGGNKVKYTEYQKETPLKTAKEQESGPKKNFVCEACGCRLAEWSNECPKCHAVGKLLPFTDWPS